MDPTIPTNWQIIIEITNVALLFTLQNSGWVGNKYSKNYSLN
jgi:hypothetical protein